MIEVVISGAGGRLGRRILAAAATDPALRVAGALVRAGSPLDGRPLGELSSAPIEGRATGDLAVIRPDTVLLIAAPRTAALEQAARAAELGAPALIATTGFEAKERAALEAHAARIPLIIAPNLSPGIAVLTELVRRASAALRDYDLELVEIHHNKKKDAPSGTAWALARAGAEARGQDIERDALLARGGETGVRGKAEIGIQALRGGDVIGEHTVYLFGPTERLELKHRAESRDVFAAGAIAAAKFLGAVGRRSGLYTMRDVLGL
ncbi:MAG: 4-hydroxy-tetrahydrodipicolinate reductase [Deltaproteobacteria bacterium]|nr:4-hydroxy-tetrahydrodipicolinate reductase [Deltaproteobacteria bacterium]